VSVVACGADCVWPGSPSFAAEERLRVSDLLHLNWLMIVRRAHWSVASLCTASKPVAGRVTGLHAEPGSWVSYGLGTENDLPGYVLFEQHWIPNGGLENFSSAFLPATHGATLLRAKGATIDNIAPSGPEAIQRRKLELLRAQDAEFATGGPEQELIESAIRNYETAFRMQTAVPTVAAIDDEPEHIRKLYGLDSGSDHKKYYSLQCLRARRLIEAGVRYVEITCPLTHANNSPGTSTASFASTTRKTR
jgi:hypothetical protein